MGFGTYPYVHSRRIGGLKLYTDPVRAEAAELKDRLAKAEEELEKLRAKARRAGGHLVLFHWW